MGQMVVSVQGYVVVWLALEPREELLNLSISLPEFQDVEVTRGPNGNYRQSGL
jgi:hypothetical protein